MIVSILYYVLSFILGIFTFFMPHWMPAQSFLYALEVVLIEIGKYNYPIPIYAIFNTIAIIVGYLFAFYLARLAIAFYLMIRGGGKDPTTKTS